MLVTAGTPASYMTVAPAVVIRPMCHSVPNQRAPSGPVVIGPGSLLPNVTGGTPYSVISPDAVIRPIFFTVVSVNHTAPSGPAVMPETPLFGVGTGYSVMVTAEVAEVAVTTRARVATTRTVLRARHTAIRMLLPILCAGPDD